MVNLVGTKKGLPQKAGFKRRQLALPVLQVKFVKTVRARRVKHRGRKRTAVRAREPFLLLGVRNDKREIRNKPVVGVP